MPPAGGDIRGPRASGPPVESRQLGDDSPGPNRSVESSPASSLTNRVRSSLTFSRKDSASPANRGSQNGPKGEQDVVFKVKSVSNLSIDRPLKDRIRSLRTLSDEICKYSSGTVTAILDATQDMFQESAGLDARKAAFNFLSATTAHTGLDDAIRAEIFELLVKPADSSCTFEQAEAIDKFTHRSKEASAFQPRLTYFVSELLSTCFIAAKQSRADKRSTSGYSREEKALTTAISLLSNLVTRDLLCVDGGRLTQLLITLTVICRQTTAEHDIKAVLFVVKVVTARVQVPAEALEPMINLLCFISYTKEQMRNEAQFCLESIFVNSEQGRAMEILLRNLPESGEEDKSTPKPRGELRGALLHLEHIYGSGEDRGVPAPPLAKLVEALKRTATINHGEPAQNQTTLMLSLKAVAAMVNNKVIVDILLEDSWTCLDGIVEMIAGAASSDRESYPIYAEISPVSPIYLFAHGTEVRSTAVTDEIHQALQRICRGLSVMYPRLALEKQTLIANILLFLGNIADPEVVSVAIDYMQDQRLVFPPNENWEMHLRLLADRGFGDTSKHPMYRLRALNLISEVYASVTDVPEYAEIFSQIFAPLVTVATAGSDIVLINRLTGFASKFIVDAEMSTFGSVLQALVDLAAEKGSHELKLIASDMFDDEVNSTTEHIVELFLRCFPYQAHKAQRIYESLLAIAINSKAVVEVRLAAWKVLLRLRCDSDGALKITNVADTHVLTTALSDIEDSTSDRSSLPSYSNRLSLTEEIRRSRSDRIRKVDSRGDSCSRTRSTVRERTLEPPRPLSAHYGSQGLAQDPHVQSDKLLKVYTITEISAITIDLSLWLEVILDIMENGSDWEIYSYVLVHLPSQLANIALFAHSIPQIERLHDLVVYQLQKSKLFEPPASTRLKKGDVAFCLYHTLTVLIAYSGWFRPQKMTDTVHTFLIGISMWERTAKCCIHALALCCHVLPKAVDKCLSLILTKMSQIISQPHLAMAILEFLNRLARLPLAFQSIGEEPLRTIFGICISYLHNSREKRQAAADTVNLRSSNRLSHLSGATSGLSAPGQPFGTTTDLPEYVYTLAYQVITHWFLAIPIEDRSKHVGWIAKNLVWKDSNNDEVVEEQSQVTLDMMHRTAFLDLGETVKPAEIPGFAENTIKKTWLVGMSIITIETKTTNGLTQIIKRQASGTTCASYQQHTAPLSPHHVDTHNQATTGNTYPPINIYPQHVFLQLYSTISPMPIPTQPIVLPDDDQSRRAISTFDRIDTVDGHKAGVIYIARGQKIEKEILANAAGSVAFDKFLAALGTKVALEGATFNTQGLDREFNMDGTHTYAWRDRVTEIVFHVPTMMPNNLEHDPQCANKKRHTGNDFVNIIFNESGLPFRFDTFNSAFNYVNIVITPEKVHLQRSPLPSANDPGSTSVEPSCFFGVQVLCDPSFPEISPAATPTIVSASALPSYVRQTALNASVFCLVWSNRGGGEHISSWRSRLREIRRLRERYANTGNTANVGYPGMGTAADRGGAKSYVEGDEWRGMLAMGGLIEEGQSLMNFDFTRWT
ncbi:MAG: hypothetical protein Q9201_006732 [Fulgogasparrea decipioides]